MKIIDPKSKGFTLIELIVVIAIIAVLAGAVFVALDPLSRFQDSRDARRYTDIKSIDEAIKLYIVENGHAPYLQDNCGPDNPDGNCFATDMPSSPYSWDLLAQDLEPFMKILPTDPCGEGCYNESEDKFFSYAYYSPGHFMNQCSGGCGEYASLSESQAATMYVIYAQNLEGVSERHWGSGSSPFNSF